MTRAYMIRRWDRHRGWIFYVGPHQQWSTDWEASAELDVDAAVDIANIYGGEAVPRSVDYAS